MADTAGNAIAPVALAFAVLDLTGSASDLGLVVGARSAALVVFVLLGGVLADRWPRSIVLVWSNVLSALTQGVAAFLILSGGASIPALVTLSLVGGAASAVSFPAAGALIADTVPSALLQKANATTASGTNGLQLIALVAGAALVAIVGPGWGLAVDAVSFAATALLFGQLRLARGTTVSSVDSAGNGSPSGDGPSPSRTTMLTDLREGWRAFLGHPWIWPVVLGFLVINAAFSGAINVLGPAVADTSIGRAGWGWVLACNAAGMLITSVVLARLERPLRLTTGVLVSGLPAVLVFALAATSRLATLSVAAFVAGIGFVVFDVAWSTNLQTNVASDQLARIYSFDMLGSILALPIGQIAVGPAAVAFGLRPTLFVLAALLFVPTLALIGVPAVRALPSPR